MSAPVLPREADGIQYNYVTASPQPSLLFLLCHGYGAPGTDLIPIGQELIQASRTISEQVAFLFPQAPLSLGGFPGFEQRAWWPIDVAALEAAMMRGETLDRRKDCPHQLDELCPRLTTLIEQERTAIGESARDRNAPLPRIVLGGFSQGAMLTTDLALRLDESPAALALLSGTLLCEERWRRDAPRRRGMRVLQSHGRQDPLLPFHAAEALKEILLGAGLDVRFVPFEGQHEIPMPVFVALRDLLHELLEPKRTGSN